MKKLKLNLEDITVNSFEIDAPGAIRGTVDANSESDVTISCTDPFSSLYKLARTFSMLCE